MIAFPLRSSLLALACCALSVSAQAETVEDAVQAAINHHPSAEAAEAFLKSREADVSSAWSGYFPTLSVSGSGGRMYGDNSTSRGLSVTRGAGYSNLWDASVSLRQPIFDGFETSNRISSAEARENSAEMDFVDTRENLALRAAQSYINVLRVRKSLDILIEQKHKAADYLMRIKSSVDQGGADEAEYQQAQDAMFAIKGGIVDYENQLRAAQANYLEAMGYVPGDDLAEPAFNKGFVPMDIDQALMQVKDTHPALRSARYVSESAEHDVESEKATLYPDINGELSYMKSEKRDILGGEAIDAKGVVRLNWDLETGAGQLARIRQKKYEYQESLSRMRERERQIQNQVYLAYSELQAAQDQLTNSQARERLNEKLFEIFKTQFEATKVTLLQVMQGESQLFTTRLETVNAQYRVLAAQYGVMASMGRLQDSMRVASAEQTSGFVKIDQPEEALKSVEDQAQEKFSAGKEESVGTDEVVVQEPAAKSETDVQEPPAEDLEPKPPLESDEHN